MYYTFPFLHIYISYAVYNRRRMILSIVIVNTLLTRHLLPRGSHFITNWVSKPDSTGSSISPSEIDVTYNNIT